jgi:hypothetical protein
MESTCGHRVISNVTAYQRAGHPGWNDNYIAF